MSRCLRDWDKLAFLSWDGELVSSIWDNDGWLDLLAVNGHVYPQMDDVKGSAAYAEPILLHRNLSKGRLRIFPSCRTD